MFEIKRYTSADAKEWDCFVPKTRNGTFLFLRSYMDYHADRFVDHSLMVYRKGKLCALLPACEKENTFVTHGGLTYGGLLMSPSIGASDVCKIFCALGNFLKAEGFISISYKAIPWIYHRIPAEEDLYALFKECGAQVTKREVASVLFIADEPVRFSESRRSGLRKAIYNRLSVKESCDFRCFWKILSDNLSAKYSATPVHSVEEIELLHSRFPENIRLFVANKPDGTIVGGVVIYECGATIHTQYISASVEGKQLGAIDILFDYILNDVYKDSTKYRYFDFGTSTRDGGHILNEPLIFQKEGFGGRGVCYDTYEWKL